MKKVAEAKRQGKRLPRQYDEKGQLINPYIPMYISKAPCIGSLLLKRGTCGFNILFLGYVKVGEEEKERGDAGVTVRKSLEHQKFNVEKKFDSSLHHERGTFAVAEQKFRKGACENCGAITHKSKDCLERPRKRGAKWSGKEIRPDEYVKEAQLDFEGKRDRWAGYDPEQYESFVKDWEEKEAIEAEKIELQKEAKKHVDGADHDDDDDDDYTDSDSELDKEDELGVEQQVKARMTVRNLRLREDTAKYLKNLAEDPAWYDPKTRSIRKRLAGTRADFVSRDEIEKDSNNVLAWDHVRRRRQGENDDSKEHQSVVDLTFLANQDKD